MINASKDELKLKEKSGHHCNRKLGKDFETILHQVNKKVLLDIKKSENLYFHIIHVTQSYTRVRLCICGCAI